jgi:hypothetical protein
MQRKSICLSVQEGVSSLYQHGRLPGWPLELASAPQLVYGQLKVGHLHGIQRGEPAAVLPLVDVAHAGHLGLVRLPAAPLDVLLELAVRAAEQRGEAARDAVLADRRLPPPHPRHAVPQHRRVRHQLAHVALHAAQHKFHLRTQEATRGARGTATRLLRVASWM